MELKVLTYNIDGLPSYLDLRNLPWWLQPARWIYQLIKNTTLVKINDNDYQSPYSIGNYLLGSEADIIAVQEDFNYHGEVSYSLEDTYWSTYHSGKISFKNIKWFPYPRFKADGLCLFVKDKLFHKVEGYFQKWNKSNGYFSHANDLLTTKGYRYYQLYMNGLFINIFNIHMDADFYNGKNDVTKDIEARRSQFKQLVESIKNINNDYPILIMGDTNSYNKYDWDVDNIKVNLIHELEHTSKFDVKEAIPNNFSDCDRIFYINNTKSKVKLELRECHFDTDTKLSDHFPLIATFNINTS